ncbi:MAG: VCBS repeat-containing protein [Myxococcales bacterium]|nr:VCBS repeat-containing protein [Myxococcales bacterium]
MSSSRRLVRPLVSASILLLACNGDDQASGSDSVSASASTSESAGTASSSGAGSASATASTSAGSGTDSATGTTQAGTDATSASASASATATTGETGTTAPATMGTSESGTTTGGSCEGAECCEMGEVFCGDVCCTVGEVCSFQKCVVPGAACKEKSDCAADEYCEYTLGEPEMMADPNCMGGVIEPNGKCLPKPPLCDPNDPPPDPNDPQCLLSCTYEPEGGFSTELKFAWGGVINPPYDSDVMMTPIVVQLDDDDCDGKVSERDIPEIVFSTFANGAYKNPGVLHAISIVDGNFVDKWAVPGVVNPTKQIAGGDLDGESGSEVVACGVDDKPRAYKPDGTLLWTAQAMTCFMPSIADLDGDGKPEVIVEGGILDGATGALKAAFAPALDTSFIVSDLDSDGLLDVITASRGYHADGQVFVNTNLANQTSFYGSSDWKSSWPAIADFDADGKPEVAVIDNLNHRLSVWRYDAQQPGKFSIVRQPVDINGGLSPALCPGGSWGNTHGGGPPTIADFDGDGTPDVGTAGGIGYAVFSGKKLVDPNVAGPATILWIKQTKDCSSASTGSSVFDFDGDGKAEVVYSDQNRLRVYEGATGNVLVERCNTTATLIEYPVIADVDSDGQADIVVISNAYAKNSPDITCTEGGVNGQSGVRVFGPTSGKWVRTRRVWNQHAYHVTNIEESGEVPAQESPNWSVPGLNNFRQNKQPDSELGSPDAIVAIEPICAMDHYTLVATVRNVGEAALPAGVIVGFYTGEPMSGDKVGELKTSKALYPLEAEVLELPFDDAPQDVKDGIVDVYAVVDDTMVPHPEWQECRTDNNVGVADGKCLMPG